MDIILWDIGAVSSLTQASTINVCTNMEGNNKSNKTQWIFIVLFSTLIIFGVIRFLLFLKKKREIDRKCKIKTAPFSHPIFGILPGVIGDNNKIFNTLMKLCQAYDEPYKAWLGPKLFIGICQPDHLETVLNNVFNKSYQYKMVEFAVGNGLWTAPEDIWKRHKKIISSTFTLKNLEGFCEVFSEKAEILLKVLDKKADDPQADIVHALGTAALAALYETALGVPSNYTEENPDYLDIGEQLCLIMNGVMKRMFTIAYHSEFIFNISSYGRKLKKLVSNIQEEVKSVIREKKMLCENNYNGSLRKMFLEMLIELPSNDKFTDEELKDEVSTMIVAGSDTTSQTLGFVMIMLGMHESIQEEVYNEVLDVLGPEKPVEYLDLTKLKYTELVIKETMRLFPIGPIIGRQVSKELKLNSGEILPVGSSIAIGILNVHRWEKYYPEPLKFDPNRFLPEEYAKRPVYAYLPFSGGPRHCVGQKYAMLSMMTYLSSVIRKFKFHTDYKSVEEIRLRQDIVLVPVDGFKLKLSKRQ